jgi:hypothetical protein
MLEYWSGKEKALVFGLIALVTVLAAALYIEMSQTAKLRGEVAALNASLYAKTSQVAQLNAALQRAAQHVASIQRAVNQSVMLSATWIVNGDKCILRLHIPVSPGWYLYIYKKSRFWGNSSNPGGYYALVEMIDSRSYQVIGLLHWYNLTDPELWFNCFNGTAIAEYQERFVFPNGSLFEMGFNGTRFISPTYCNGICSPLIPLYMPISKPLRVDLVLFYFPPGWDGYSVLYSVLGRSRSSNLEHYPWPFIVELPVKVEQVH